MSRNYELLTQLSEQEIAIEPAVPVSAPAVAAVRSRVPVETGAGEEDAKLVQLNTLKAHGVVVNDSGL